MHMAGNDNQPPCGACPRCGASGVRFARNGTRDRVYRRLEAGVVVATPGRVARWKCPACRHSFTVYPAHALPFTRFTRDTVHRMCARYLGDPCATYRSAVRDGGVPIAYPEPAEVASGHDDCDAETPVLSHTTLYRWLTALGRGPAQECHPSETTTHGSPAGAVPAAGKCRSDARRAVLAHCLAVLRRWSAPDNP
jgi:hypothetical protein